MKYDSTSHISEAPGDFSQTILMPGDPLCSKLIAENFLENAKLVNNVRGVQGYTCTYKDVKVSTMGMPFMGICSNELFNFFEVQNIVRIGSARAINERIKTGDIVIGQYALAVAGPVNSISLAFFLPFVFMRCWKTASAVAVRLAEDTLQAICFPRTVFMETKITCRKYTRQLFCSTKSSETKMRCFI